MKTSNNEMKSTTSSVKSFKCDCCDYITNRNQNLIRHKQTHLKKGGDDLSVLTDEDQPASVSSKDCRMCINYKQLIEMKDNRIADLEKKIELLEKDTKIAVLETKLGCQDVMVDMSGNFIGLQQQTIDNVIQMKQTQAQPQPRGRVLKTAATEETNPVLPTVVSVPEPKPVKRRALTKDDLAMQDYHESMKEISEKMKQPLPVKSNVPREINVDYLNEICGNAEPFENLVERAFDNPKYFEMSNLSEEQLRQCKMPKNDYYVCAMLKFQEHHLKPSKSKKALMEYQVDLQSKEKFYNSLFLEAFVKQNVKSFYYVKKTRQSFYKCKDTWKILESEDFEKIVKLSENRIMKAAMYACNMLKAGVIPSMRYGYKTINYDILNSGKPSYDMPSNEKELIEDLKHYIQGLMESCDNERQTDILFKQLKQTYDARAVHNSGVSIKYDKEKETCEADAAKSDSEEEE